MDIVEPIINEFTSPTKNSVFKGYLEQLSIKIERTTVCLQNAVKPLNLSVDGVNYKINCCLSQILLRDKRPKGPHIMHLHIIPPLFLTDWPGRPSCFFRSAPTYTNCVEDIKILLPVKFR